MAADPILYCLEHLNDDREFERLAATLMARDGYASIEPLGGNHDRGRDALYADRTTAAVVVFAFSIRKDWQAKMREDARRIQVERHPCSRLVFVTTQAISAPERDRAVEAIHRDFGWPLELYSSERLRVLLASHPDLLRHHPAIFTPDLFPAIRSSSDQPPTLVPFRNANVITETPDYRALADAGYDFNWTSGASLGESLAQGWEYFEWRGPNGERFRACMGEPSRPGNVLVMRKSAGDGR